MAGLKNLNLSNNPFQTSEVVYRKVFLNQVSHLLSQTLSALSGAGKYTTVWQGFFVWNRLWPGLDEETKQENSEK